MLLLKVLQGHSLVQALLLLQALFPHPYILSTGKGSSILVSGHHSRIKLEWKFVIFGFVFIFYLLSTLG